MDLSVGSRRSRPIRGLTQSGRASARLNPHQPDLRASTIFQEAIDSFHHALSEDDKRRFRRYETPESMIIDLENHCRTLKEKRKLLASCEVVSSFAKGWSPFFDIINFFVSSHPEVAGIAWGAIRLVFLLSSNYVSFFEKLSEMLGRMLSRLPCYADHLERLQSHQSIRRGIRSRLIQAMSYVYSDFIQFCQDACRIFTNKRGGARHTINVVRDLFWTPFDVRFSGFLDRLRDHQELFDIELRLEDSRAFEDSMTNVMKEIVNVKTQLSQPKLAADAASKRQHILRNRINEIKRWISSPDYSKEFENARRNRFPNTGHWVSEHNTYKSWKNISTFKRDSFGSFVDLEVAFSKRVLCLQANPGFGKTTLSAHLIEDLRYSAPLTRTRASSSNVTFFYFDSRTVDKTSQSHALRAVVLQLIHQHQDAEDIIDSISLLMDVSGSGHPQASDDEILEMLTLFILRLPGITIVFDGVDECIESMRFLRTIHSIFESSTSKVLLLGRPNIKFPPAYLQGRHQIDGMIYSNLNDIRLYLRSEVDDLLQTKKISGNLSQEEITNLIADRSRSMFLFAKLMIEYLQSPALSPTERPKEIQSLSLVEGLESMYERVTDALAQRFAKEKSVVYKILRFLVVAIRPVTITEIRIYLAMRPGKTTDESNLIEDLDCSLLLMCGALIEMDDGGVVRFVHSSVKEYLTSETERQKQNFFYVDLCEHHFDIAKYCLSYLVHDMPSSPLSGDAAEPANTDDLQQRLPFLAYAALAWAQHLAEGIKAQEEDSHSDLMKFRSSIAPFFAVFLQDKDCVTAWIEASWTMESPPDLNDLVEKMAQLDNQIGVSEDSPLSFSWICQKLRCFACDLGNLGTEWKQLLAKRPNEIWGASVTAFSTSEFWSITNSTSILAVVPKDEISGGKPILNLSKVSTDGQTIGILEVFEMSTGVNARFKEVTSDDPDLTGNFLQWSARYQIRSTAGDSVPQVNFEIDIPAEDLQHVERQCLDSRQRLDPFFRFPVSFGGNLKQIVILHTVVRSGGVAFHSQDSRPRQYSFQEIDLSPKIFPRLERSYEEEEYPSWYRIWLSPNGRHLAVSKRRGKPDVVRRNPGGYWSVAVWKDESLPHQEPHFVPLHEIYLNSTNLAKDGTLAFHHRLPLLVVSGDLETVLWNFGSPDHLRKRTIYNFPLSGFTFSPDGNFLYSPAQPLHKSVTIDVRPFIEDRGHIFLNSGIEPDSCPEMGSFLEYPGAPNGNGWLANNSSVSPFLNSLVQSGAPALQEANALAARNSSDDVELSTVHRFQDIGAVVRGSLKRGRHQMEALAFLPQSSKDTNVTLLDPFSEDEYVRMVITNEAKDAYTFDDPKNLVPPAIIQRQRNTIETYSPSAVLKRRRKGNLETNTDTFDLTAPDRPTLSIELL